MYYMSGKLSGVERKELSWFLKTKTTGDVIPGRYIVLLEETGEGITEKAKVIEVVAGKGIIIETPAHSEDLDVREAVKWAIVKDDVPPAEIFRLHREGGSAGRATVAAYCIQDCDLVVELYKKLDVFNNAMSMANVCSVPVSYIFTRGQGIKIESLIFKECYELGMLVPVLESTPFGSTAPVTGQEESYEGAIVLDPVPGFYNESPIGVCDFAYSTRAQSSVKISVMTRSFGLRSLTSMEILLKQPLWAMRDLRHLVQHGTRLSLIHGVLSLVIQESSPRRSRRVCGSVVMRSLLTDQRALCRTLWQSC